MATTDILVLGGGPAGATLAALAARAGARVVVVEHAQFPRDKVCGEFVAAEGCEVLERLGVLDALVRAGARPMRHFGITDARGRWVESDLPALPGAASEALGVTRALLDSTLLELARDSGVEVRERCDAIAPLIEDGRVCGARVRPVGSGSDGEPLRARVVVAADGRRSMLLRALHPGEGDPTRTGRRSWFGAKVHLDGAAGDLAGRVELHLFDRGYAGLAPVEQGRVNLCMMLTVGTLRSCGGVPLRVLRERVYANPAARERLSELKICGGWKSVGPLRFGARRCTSAGAMFVGDAAGTIDPYSGEGISNAMAGAEMAATYALEAARTGMLTDELALAYGREWSAAFAPVTRRVRRLGWLIDRPRLGARAVGLASRLGPAVVRRLVATTRTGGLRRPG